MNVRWPVLVVVLVAACAVASGGRARAAATCTVTTAMMPFGNYDVYGPALAVSGTIDMSCTGSGNPAPTATLGNGNGTVADRYMLCASGACLSGFAGDQLHYNLYTTAGHTTVWGATGVASTPAGCKNTTCSWTVFGLIPAAIGGGVNDVAVGGYTDAVTITVAY